MSGETALVVGAGGGIGRAVAERFLALGHRVVAVSRNPPAPDDSRMEWLQGGADEHEITALLEGLQGYGGTFSRVVICTGILHQSGDRQLQPEKRLEAVHAEQLLQIIHINTVLPSLWVAGLLPVLAGKQPCVLAALSARVGSIGDNRLGGWYSYRSSKAALNMFLRTAAIEYARRAKNVKLLAFHPGTTDTALSRPFQANVPANKLFTPAFVAERLTQVMSGLGCDGELSYLDWQGEPVPW